MRLPFAVQSYTHRSLPVSAQRLINLFPERQPETAKAPMILLPTPGLREFATLGADPVRGMHVMGGALYVVAGAAIYLVPSAGAPQLIGTIDLGGPVSLDSDGERLCIVVPETQAGWVVDRSAGTLTRITDADFAGASSVTVLDGYFIFSKPNSGEFFWSAINNPLSFNALDFATAEGAPDNLVAVQRVGRDLWLFGEQSTEIWGSVGAADGLPASVCRTVSGLYRAASFSAVAFRFAVFHVTASGAEAANQPSPTTISHGSLFGASCTSVASNLSSAAFHSFTVPSPLAEASCVPSALSASPYTQSV